MWFSSHETHAREADMQFYLPARVAVHKPPANIWGCPGEAFFVKKRVGARALLSAAHGDARSRPKSPVRPPRSSKWSPKARNGCPRGAFWETFCHFLGDCGVLLDATHSQAKTYIFGFGRSQVGTCSSTFQGVDFRACFYTFWGWVFSPLGAPGSQK